jgi:photosystem II stability/assembly factor-like uncharacterized protein
MPGKSSRLYRQTHATVSLRKLIPALFFLVFCLSCSKSVPKTTSTVPPSDTTAVTPSLYNPVPLDTLYDWVRIGRITYTMLDIWFTSATVGFITNDSSLFKTVDNGITWSKISNSSNVDIFNLQFVDDQNGFVQGASKLGITQDGGTTWVFKNLPSTSAIYFQFTSPTIGFYSDAVQTIQKTSDAGNHWTSISNTAQKSFPFYFLDSSMGFSMYNGDCNKTADGGLNWVTKKTQVATNGQGYYKMQFLDTLTGYCATPAGLSKTTDGGVTWANCLPSTTRFMIPYFIDAGNGYCLDNDAIYKTTDGGQHWTLSCKLNNDRFSGSHFLDMSTGWASTFGGYFLRLK